MDEMINTPPKIPLSNLGINACENILLIDQKLKGLQAEIQAKLDHPFYSGDNLQEYIDKLTKVATEINSAINGLDTLVRLINSEPVEDQGSGFNSEEDMQHFCKEIALTLEKITELKKEF